MLLEKITDEELEMITTYRENYAFHTSATYYGHYSFADSREVLREWASAKQELFKLFGENLILKKDFTYERSNDQLMDEFTKYFFNKEDNVVSFYKEYKKEMRSLTREAFGSFESFDNKFYLTDMIEPYCLAKGKYTGPNIDLVFPNGKTYRVTHGCKISKALGKIANGFNIPCYEDFRIYHSQVLNQKFLKGQLVISIHPLDYMTMSDNECGWDSCMSWKKEGEYRQGTVEMMNSPCVVVAYLESEKPMTIGKHTWSNKKWRQLFVCDRAIIASIKDYPYYNRHLSEIVVDWLKELAEANLGREYGENQKYLDEYSNSRYFHKNLLDGDGVLTEYVPSFYTEMMYNDFGCVGDYHVIAVNENLEPSDFVWDRWNGNYKLEVGYSGKSQCMICGKVTSDMDSPEMLNCEDCGYVPRCSWCGDTTPEDYLVEFNGEYICQSCYEDNVRTCEYCNEEFYYTHLKNVVILPNLDKSQQKEMYEKEMRKNCWLEGYDERLDYNYVPNAKFHVCEDCVEGLKKEILAEGADFYYANGWRYENYLFVFFDDLSQATKKSYFPDVNNSAEYVESLETTGYWIRDLGKLRTFSTLKDAFSSLEN